MVYCAITADIVDSRNYENRSELIAKLKKAVEIINIEYQEHLAAKFIIYSGDELQGLLKEPAYSYRLIRSLERAMKPVELHFGVGIGGISTEVPGDLNKAYTGELDGEAYYHAREMLNQVKKSQQNVIYYFDMPACDLINSLLAFIYSTEKTRTNRQWETVSLYEELETQKLVAEELGINQTTVSRNLQRSFYYQIKRAEESIFQYLAHI
ncbi:MAG: SatD family protein [Bacillota bacterium]